MTDAEPLSFCLFGTSAPANLGLDALRSATVGTVLGAAPGAQVTVFDDGLGTREGQAYVAGSPVSVALQGARDSLRVHRPEAYLNMRASAGLGGLRNPGLARLDSADVVLDLSGGDSFSDIYGRRTFRIVAWPKRLALLRGRPLVLLPQTYGPFHHPRVRAAAADLVRHASAAWARDPDSYEALRDLLGADLDPARHREGVDVAFALEPRHPDGPALDRLRSWWGDGGGPVVGVNVSGLMFNGAGARFSLKADGWTVVRALCERLLSEQGTRIMLVPHVRSGSGVDDDNRAIAALADALAPRYGERVAVAPAGLDAAQTKWLVSHFAWFVGMRMHATIAALSSGVPVAAVAYSMKARGVFATVGQEKHVADARHANDDELLDHLWRSWQGRAEAAADLAVHAPEAAERARRQVVEVVALARAERQRRVAGRR